MAVGVMAMLMVMLVDATLAAGGSQSAFRVQVGRVTMMLMIVVVLVIVRFWSLVGTSVILLVLPIMVLFLLVLSMSSIRTWRGAV